VKFIIERTGILTESELNPEDTLFGSLAEKSSPGLRFPPLEEENSERDKTSSQLNTETLCEEEEEGEWETSEFGEEHTEDFGEGSPS